MRDAIHIRDPWLSKYLMYQLFLPAWYFCGCTLPLHALSPLAEGVGQQWRSALAPCRSEAKKLLLSTACRTVFQSFFPSFLLSSFLFSIGFLATRAFMHLLLFSLAPPWQSYGGSSDLLQGHYTSTTWLTGLARSKRTSSLVQPGIIWS